MVKKRRDKIDWIMIREQWMESHIQKKGMNFRQLAAANDISWAQVRNRASQEDWTGQLELRLQHYDQEVARRLGAAANAVTEKLQDQFIGNEIEIRRRHAKAARGIQGKALERIATMSIEEMKPSDAIAMLKLGLEEERRAMGMPNDYVAPAETGRIHPEFRTVQEQERDHGKIAKAAGAILAALREAGKMAQLPNTTNEIQDARDALNLLEPPEPVLVIPKEEKAA